MVLYTVLIANLLICKEHGLHDNVWAFGPISEKLGKFLSPHKKTVSIPTQTNCMISSTSLTWGVQFWGGPPTHILHTNLVNTPHFKLNNRKLWSVCSMPGKSSKNVLPNGGLMVIYHDTISKNITKKHISWPHFFCQNVKLESLTVIFYQLGRKKPDLKTLLLNVRILNI